MKGCKLSPSGLGLALGVLWGLTLFVMGLVAYYFSYGRPFVEIISAIYLGYEPSIKGSFIGGISGFVGAFIIGFLVAWLYNLFSCCSCMCCSKPKNDTEKS